MYVKAEQRKKQKWKTTNVQKSQQIPSQFFKNYFNGKKMDSEADTKGQQNSNGE